MLVRHDLFSDSNHHKLSNCRRKTTCGELLSYALSVYSSIAKSGYYQFHFSLSTLNTSTLPAGSETLLSCLYWDEYPEGLAKWRPLELHSRVFQICFMWVFWSVNADCISLQDHQFGVIYCMHTAYSHWISTVNSWILIIFNCIFNTISLIVLRRSRPTYETFSK